MDRPVSKSLRESPIILVTRPDGQPAMMREDVFKRLEYKGFKRGYQAPKEVESDESPKRGRPAK